MFIDKISYKLADGVTEDALREAAADILEVWMKKQEGFLGWDINSSESGYTDLVYWASRAAADKATENMKDIPEDHQWMQCYDMSTITAEKLENIFSHRS